MKIYYRYKMSYDSTTHLQHYHRRRSTYWRTKVLLKVDDNKSRFEGFLACHDGSVSQGIVEMFQFIIQILAIQRIVSIVRERLFKRENNDDEVEQN